MHNLFLRFFRTMILLLKSMNYLLCTSKWCKSFICSFSIGIQKIIRPRWHIFWRQIFTNRCKISSERKVSKVICKILNGSYIHFNTSYFFVSTIMLFFKNNMFFFQQNYCSNLLFLYYCNSTNAKLFLLKLASKMNHITTYTNLK